MARKRGTIVPTLGKFIGIQWYGKQFISWFGHSFATPREAEKFHAALGRAIQIFRNHTRCGDTRYAYDIGANEPLMLTCMLQKGHRGHHDGVTSRRDDQAVTILKWGKHATSDNVAKLAYHKRKKEQRRRKKKAEKNKRRK